MKAFVVAGRAGAGKSTLGEALARRTDAVLLDLDTVTNSLLDRVFATSGLPGHWNDARHRDVIRPARYAALLAVGADQARLGRDVVLAAPFSAELQGGPEWAALCRAFVGAEMLVVWLHACDHVLSGRVLNRGEVRDTATGLSRPESAPRIPHLSVDATMATNEQVDVVLAASATAGT